MSVRPADVYVAVAAGLVVSTVILRGQAISNWGFLNPDEAELMAQARLAVHSPVPFSTWATGIGPYWVLFLAGLGALGAPLTLAFAHLLSAVLLALTAFVLFVAASRAFGRGPALVATVVWWFPIAITFPVGPPSDFSALSTEYLPILLIVSSALVPREQLVARPWLFAVLGVLAGLAVGSKYQVGPLAAAWVAAQLIVLRPSVKGIVVSVLWWLVGAALPAATIVLVMVASPATNWTIVEQIVSFLTSYTGSRSPMRRVTSTFGVLMGPVYWLVVAAAGLIWLGRHSEKRSNVARAILVAGGLIAMLGGPAGGVKDQATGGFPHYLIIFFGAVGLALTMPVKAGAQLIPQWLSPRVLAGALAIVAALVLVNGSITDRWAPLSPRGAAAALSADSVNRNPELARACPPGSPVLVWGWRNELYVAQDWQSTIPYPNVLNLSMSPANRETGEAVIRAGIERADCVVETTGICSGCPRLSADLMLPRYYPELGELVSRQFHNVPVSGCDGCTVNVRDRASAASRRARKGGRRRNSAAPR